MIRSARTRRVELLHATIDLELFLDVKVFGEAVDAAVRWQKDRLRALADRWAEKARAVASAAADDKDGQISACGGELRTLIEPVRRMLEGLKGDEPPAPLPEGSRAPKHILTNLRLRIMQQIHADIGTRIVEALRSRAG